MNTPIPTPDDTPRWFLRTDDGTVYGPAKLQRMILWAEEGKIRPGFSLSQDSETWTPAENVAALDLRWYIGDDTGQLRGPLNKRAAEALIAAAPNPAILRLVSAREAAQHPVAAKHPPTAGTPTPPAAGTSAPPTGDASATSGFALAADARADTPPPAAAKAKPRDDNAKEKELHSQVSRLTQSNDELQNAVKNANQAIEKLEAGLEHARIELDAARQANAALEARFAESTVANAALAAELEAARQDALAQAGEHDQTRRHAAALQEAHDQLLIDFAELTDLANARDNKYRDTIATLEGELEQVRTRLPSREDLRPLLMAEVESLDKEIERERTSAEAFRALLSERQRSLQQRQQQLLQQINATPQSSSADNFHKSGAQSRLQADLQLMRDTHTLEMRKAEERENALARKLRSTESSLNQLHTQLASMEKHSQAVQELQDTISRQKQQLTSLEKQRDADLARFETDRSMLMDRIGHLETAAQDTPSERPPHRTHESEPRFRFLNLK